MSFKITAIAAACIALAPAAFAEGTNKTGTTSGMSRGSGHMATGAHSAMSSDQVRQIQQALSDRGYDPGPVDGVMGPKTQQAMHNFRQAQGLTGSDSMDSATLSALGVDATGSSGTGDPSRRSSGTTGAGGTMGSRVGTPGTTGSETPPTTSTGSSSTPTTPSGSQMPSTSTGPMGSGSMGGTPSNSTNTNSRSPSSSMPDNRGTTGTDSYGSSGGQRP